jgi:predicted amino acid-binding ACT domain protein
VDIVAISEVSLSFTMETKRLPAALLADLEKIADVNCENDQAIICLVGEDIHGKPGIAASVFNTVADAGVNIRMISQGASEINISFVVSESDVPKAVRRLHEHFFPASASKSRTGRGKTNGVARHQHGAQQARESKNQTSAKKLVVNGKRRAAAAP